MKNSKAQKIESNITYAINEFLKDIENTKDILKFQKITPESLEASFLKKFEDVLIDELTYKIEQDIKDAGFTKVEYGKDQLNVSRLDDKVNKERNEFIEDKIQKELKAKYGNIEESERLLILGGRQNAATEEVENAFQKYINKRFDDPVKSAMNKAANEAFNKHLKSLQTYDLNQDLTEELKNYAIIEQKKLDWEEKEGEKWKNQWKQNTGKSDGQAASAMIEHLETKFNENWLGEDDGKKWKNEFTGWFGKYNSYLTQEDNKKSIINQKLKELNREQTEWKRKWKDSQEGKNLEQNLAEEATEEKTNFIKNEGEKWKTQWKNGIRSELQEQFGKEFDDKAKEKEINIKARNWDDKAEILNKLLPDAAPNTHTSYGHMARANFIGERPGQDSEQYIKQARDLFVQNKVKKLPEESRENQDIMRQLEEQFGKEFDDNRKNVVNYAIKEYAARTTIIADAMKDIKESLGGSIKTICSDIHKRISPIQEDLKKQEKESLLARDALSISLDKEDFMTTSRLVTEKKREIKDDIISFDGKGRLLDYIQAKMSNLIKKRFIDEKEKLLEDAEKALNISNEKREAFEERREQIDVLKNKLNISLENLDNAQQENIVLKAILEVEVYEYTQILESYSQKKELTEKDQEDKKKLIAEIQKNSDAIKNIVTPQEAKQISLIPENIKVLNEIKKLKEIDNELAKEYGKNFEVKVILENNKLDKAKKEQALSLENLNSNINNNLSIFSPEEIKEYEKIGINEDSIKRYFEEVYGDIKIDDKDLKENKIVFDKLGFGNLVNEKGEKISYQKSCDEKSKELEQGTNSIENFINAAPLIPEIKRLLTEALNDIAAQRKTNADIAQFKNKEALAEFGIEKNDVIALSPQETTNIQDENVGIDLATLTKRAQDTQNLRNKIDKVAKESAINYYNNKYKVEREKEKPALSFQELVKQRLIILSNEHFINAKKTYIEGQKAMILDNSNKITQTEKQIQNLEEGIKNKIKENKEKFDKEIANNKKKIDSTEANIENKMHGLEIYTTPINQLNKKITETKSDEKKALSDVRDRLQKEYDEAFKKSGIIELQNNLETQKQSLVGLQEMLLINIGDKNTEIQTMNKQIKELKEQLSLYKLIQSDIPSTTEIELEEESLNKMEKQVADRTREFEKQVNKAQGNHVKPIDKTITNICKDSYKNIKFNERDVFLKGNITLNFSGKVVDKDGKEVESIQGQYNEVYKKVLDHNNELDHNTITQNNNNKIDRSTLNDIMQGKLKQAIEDCRTEITTKRGTFQYFLAKVEELWDKIFGKKEEKTNLRDDMKDIIKVINKTVGGAPNNDKVEENQGKTSYVDLIKQREITQDKGGQSIP